MVDLTARVMTAPEPDGTPKLSRVEVVGAWLGVWTPPRDARVPPVPWRRLAVGALVLAVVTGAALAVTIPTIDAAKDERSAREQRALDERVRARRERLAAEQQPRFGAAGTTRRADVVAHVERAIGADARERFSRRARTADCAPAPGVDETARRVVFDCFSATSDIVGGQGEGVRGTIALPFRAAVDFGDGSYAFCKVNPPPGEQGNPDPRTLIEVPRVCRTQGP